MLWGHDDRIAAAVQERVLPRAPGMTWGQLRAALTRAILAEVPDGEQRHRRARRERRVDLYPGQDGMATLSAFLSAAEATASFEWVTRLARGVQPAPDGAGRGRGSMDRRRADVLVALLTGRLVATTDEAATTAPADHTNTAPTNTAPAGTASGHADCRNTAPTATATAPGHAAPTDRAPSSLPPSYTAPGGSTPTGTAPTGNAPTDTAPTDTASAGLRSSHAGDADLAGTSSSSTGPAFARAADPVGGAVVLAAPVSAHRPLIHLTMPLSTLLGLDDEPAELAGYGPLPADVARDIALDPDSTWRRLLTDPVTGRLLDHGRTTYRPPTGLAGFVRTRDGTCRHPGCRRPAVACELDHVHPWAAGGTTSEDNICALCERHHDLKEQVGWQVVLHGDRTLEWTTPTGHRYRSRPVEHPVPPPAEQPPAEPVGAETARAAPDPRTWGRVDPFTLARASAPAGLDHSPPF